MKTALVITVGNTADPILKAVEEARQEAGEVIVYLLYGRAFPGQTPTPFDVTNEAKRKSEEIGVSVKPREVPDPEDINASLAALREVLREVADASRVVVNFTGGTKVLSAAAVHAALTVPLIGELVLDYTGGQVRDKQGRVVREAMRVKRSERTATDELLNEVLALLHQARYREARLPAKRLPELGRGGFVKKAAEALYLWDEFDYEAAFQVLARLNEPAKTLRDDERVSALAALIGRLVEPGKQIGELVRPLRQLQQNSAKLKETEQRHFPLLVADALENAHRRFFEERYTDSVLRSYRAVEVAIQSQLLGYGVNPWHPDWQTVPEETKTRVLELLAAAALPRDLALFTGSVVLQALGRSFLEEWGKRQKDLQVTRNSCYLEHGYHRLGRDDAQRLLGYAEVMCTELLAAPLDAPRASVRHWS